MRPERVRDQDMPPGQDSETAVSLADRYEMQRRIASGGMGVVWEATDTVLERPVAIKILSPALAGDERFLERFRREARAAAGLTHPNVAQVYDYGEDGRTRFIVMELLRGETLAARLHREGRLPPAEAASIGAQTADALEAAHRAGLVHRDVKPGNIMLTPDGVKVMDFGIAAAAHDTSLTATGSLIGTANYMAPEHVSGDPATPSSDVYALAVVMYEALTGTPPFDMETPVATAAAHVHTAPDPLLSRAPEVPAPLAAAVERGLEKEPAARPRSAAEFARQLRAGASAAGGSAAPTVQLRATQTDPLPAPDAAAPTDTLPRRGSSPPAMDGRRRWLLVAMAVLAGIILWALIAAALAGGSGTATPPPSRSPSPTPSATPTATLPVIPASVVGMRVDDAVAALRNLGIQVDSIVHVKGKPPGPPQGEGPGGPGPGPVVTSVTPPPGSRVGPGTRVILFVTDSPGHGPPGHDGGDQGGHHGNGQGDGGD
jgi:eukaryotic-like serine/threonine-protein kinase